MCTFKNVSVCAGSTRTCFNMCAWCRYKRARLERTHGDVLGGHTWGVFSSVKQVFFPFLEHLNRMLGSSLIANFLLTRICPHMGYHVLQRFTKETLGSYMY